MAQDPLGVPGPATNDKALNHAGEGEVRAFRSE
jgi:hypothetical protein